MFDRLSFPLYYILLSDLSVQFLRLFFGFVLDHLALHRVKVLAFDHQQGAAVRKPKTSHHLPQTPNVIQITFFSVNFKTTFTFRLGSKLYLL